MKPAYVIGCGLWMPGYPTVQAWSDRAKEETGKPACEIVPSRLRRHLSVLTRLQVECVYQAGTSAGFDLEHTPTVFGSSLGEIQIAVAQMKMMKSGEGIVSPAYFKNSVHNTAGGALSIATKNRGFTTAMAGGPETLATALLEAMALISTDETDVIVVVGDEARPEPLDAVMPYETLGVAFALSSEPKPGAIAKLDALSYGGKGAPIDVPAEFRHNPSAPALALFEAIRGERWQSISLTFGDTPSWSMEVAAC